MMKGLTESLLMQPPSSVKKKSYDVHQVLGTGTFGKVVVRPLIYLKYFDSYD
jgi:calcium/calmodulin-dependent protein kinase I